MVAPAIGPSYFQDLQNVTRANQGVGKVTDIASSLREATAASLLLEDGKIKKSGQGGKSFTWTCMVNGSGSFAMVPMIYQDQLSNVDTTAVASADWRHMKVDWPEVGQVTAMNSPSDVQIASTRMLQEAAAKISEVEGLEAQLWQSPVGVTDTISLWGFNIWLPRPSTYTVDGFVGTVPSGYTSVGLNPTTYPNWKVNYFQYGSVTDELFVRPLMKSMNDTSFSSLAAGIPQFNTNLSRMFFTNYGVIGPLQELLKASNQNMGLDITNYYGKPLINGMPVNNVPYLDRETTNPIFAINMDDFEFVYLDGFYRKKTTIKNMPGFHNVTGNFRDTTCQLICRNRRRSFTGATAAAYAA